MKIRLMVRGYLGRTLQWEKPFNVESDQIEKAIPQLVRDHASQMMNYEISLIELEFLDEPNVNERFYRFGSIPEGMVRPMRWPP